MHVERQVIQPTGVLATGAGTLPPTKGLESRPGTGCGALRPVGVDHARLDIIKEPAHFLFRAIEAGCQPIFDAVGQSIASLRSLTGWIIVIGTNISCCQSLCVIGTSTATVGSQK